MSVHDDPPPRSTRPRPEPIPGRIADMAGRPLLVLDAVVTVLFLLVTILAGVTDDDRVFVLDLVVVGAIFVGTCVLFLIGFLLAAARSRDDQLHLAGLFYLSRAAPDAVRRAFMGLWFAQIGIGVLSILITSPPFGVMAAMFGVFVNMVWSARHGIFRPHGTGDPPGAASAAE